MKKKLLFCIWIVLLALTFVAVGCSKKTTIPVPANLTIEENVLSWDAVTGALTYDVRVDEEVYSIEDTRFSLPIYDYVDHEVTVRVTTREGTGEYASPIIYKRRESTVVLPQLSVPYGISMTANRLMWSTVLNNNGYKIFFDGKTYTAAKNATYYDLEFSRDGTFYVQMQTIGDGVTYASSKMSAQYAVTVKEGKAPLQKLPKTDFSFNPQTKTLEWINKYSAAAVSYEIYQDELADPVEVIPADATRTKLSYALALTGSRVTYTMRLISNNGLYSASDFGEKITFPLVDEIPTGLALTARADISAYCLEWSERTFSDGYILEIDGEPYELSAARFIVPSVLSAGRHVARVKTHGNGIYYADSGYSAGVVFYTEDHGVIAEPLDAPVFADLRCEEEKIVLTLVEDALTAAYRFRFYNGTAYFDIQSDVPELTLTPTTVNDRDATDAERDSLTNLFRRLPEGVVVTATLLPKSVLHKESLSSEEEILTTNSEVVVILPPTDFRYEDGEFVWTSREDTEYEIYLDGAPLDVTDSTAVLPEGEHRAKIRAKGAGGLFSKEIRFRTPVDLAAPTALSVNAGILSFGKSEHAAGYVLYSNGEFLADVRVSENVVPLANYLKTDGNYVLTLRAIAVGSLYRNSPLSAEYLYVKTDGAYGTEVKPYRPLSAAELMSLMREHPTAHFALSARGEYDFTDYDLARAADFDFSGTLRGNGATLKGMSLKTSLFRALKEATLSDLTFEITANGFAFDKSGVLAERVENSVLQSLTVEVSGRTVLLTDTDGGILFCEGSEVSLSDLNLTLDLTMESAYTLRLGGVASNYRGDLERCAIDGTLAVTAATVRFGGVSVDGDLRANAVSSELAVDLRGTNALYVGGATLTGSFSGSGLTYVATYELDAPTVEFSGIATTGMTLANSTIGGRAEAKGRSIELYGATADGILSMTDVSVTATLRATSTDALTVAGLAKEVSSTTDLTGTAFRGEIDAKGRSVTVAALAITSEGEHSLTAAASLTAEGDTVNLAGGVLNAEVLTLHAGNTIVINDVGTASVGGAALTVSGSLSLTGETEITAKGDSLLVGGAVARGNAALSANDYHVTGDLEGDIVRGAGFLGDGEEVSLDLVGCAVELRVKSDDAAVAGAILTATGLTLPTTTLNATVTAEGEARVAGFALDLGNLPLSDLTVIGALTLKGSGYLYGVAEQCGAATRVTSRASLRAEGEVEASGMFGTLASATDLTFKAGTITLIGDELTYYGVVSRVGNETLNGVSVENSVISAEPRETGASIELYGITDRASVVKNVRVDNTYFTVGAFSSLSFGGIANGITQELSDSELDYNLTSEALSADIGGAALSGSGQVLRTKVGSVGDPLSVRSRGETIFGGLYGTVTGLTVEGGGVTLSLDLDLPQGENEIGGLFGRIVNNTGVSLSECAVSVSVTKVGAGAAKIGGAVGMQLGYLRGAKVDVDLTATGEDDAIGGVAAALAGSTLYDACATGRITSNGKVGGIVCDAENASLNGAFSAVTVAATGEAGGLFHSAKSAVVHNVACVSRLTNLGAGLFYEGSNLSLNSCYFAGAAQEYALAATVSNSSATALYVDASLSDLTLIGTGDLPCEARSLGYGYTETELGSRFTADGSRYPYVTSVGYPLAAVDAETTGRDPVAISGDVDLYSILPRRYDALTPTVTWVDGDGLLLIENGMATVLDNGRGVLYGVLPGGARVYRVEYTTEGFVPFEGEGTLTSPYIIANDKYFRYVKTYSENDPQSYFKFEIEGDEVSGTVFGDLFTKEEPFRGHIDFNGVKFLSPVIGENGILGAIEEATVTGLDLEGAFSGVILAASAKDSTISNVTLRGTVAGNVSLVASAEDSAISDVTAVLVSSEGVSLVLFGTVKGGVTERVSLALRANCAANVEAYLIGSGEGATVRYAQAFCNMSVSGATVSVTREDVGSAYSHVMLLADVTVFDEEHSALAGFAMTANGASYVHSATMLSGNCVIHPLVGSGSATYDDVKVLAEGATDRTGVTALTVTNARATIALIDGFVSGDVATPLGYDLYEETEEIDFLTFDPDTGSALASVVLTESVLLEDVAIVEGNKPFSELVVYDFTGDCAVIAGDTLRLIGVGSGVLTLTNVYGYAVEITVTVESFDGFANGSGTESDPYLISSFEDYLKIPDHEGSVFKLTADLAGEITETRSFAATLYGDHHTLTLTLTAPTLYESAQGEIYDLNLVLNRDVVSYEEGGALFASTATGLVMKDTEITLSCGEITLGENVTFGLLFREAIDVRLEDVTLDAGSVTLNAAGGRVGVLAGDWENSFMKSLSVTADVTLNATDELIFGVVGVFDTDTTYESYYDNVLETTVSRYYADGVTVDLTVNAQTAALTIGALAGKCRATLKDVSVTMNFTIAGTSVRAGGLIGELTENAADVLSGDISGVITADVSSGYFGGLVGYSLSENALDGATVSVVKNVTATGEAHTGDIVGNEPQPKEGE